MDHDRFLELGALEIANSHTFFMEMPVQDAHAVFRPEEWAFVGNSRISVEDTTVFL